MKPAKFKKIRKEDLPEDPQWLKATAERVKKSPLAEMTEEEIGQWTEELAEEAAGERESAKAVSP